MDALPHNTDKIALVLQGGGALGAYQGGVYQALHEAGMEPGWVTGVSIGSVNAAIIAGNHPEHRLPRLREFWETVTSRGMSFPVPDGDVFRSAFNTFSAWTAMSLGQPGFFQPASPGPLLAQRGAKTATNFYDTSPLRETLLRLVDFDLLSNGPTRFAVGAVNVTSANFAYFDNATAEIVPEHVMASGALPPALPMVRVGSDYYWDGGLVSNTPLQHLLDHAGDDNMLVFQVDLFSASGAPPRDLAEVLTRMKDIQYSSRTRLITDTYKTLQTQKIALRRLLEKLPEEALSDDERRMKRELARLPNFTILQLIYRQAAYEGQMKDYEFSAASMREHWEAGCRDTKRTLRHREWLRVADTDAGVIVRDVHQYADGQG